MTSYVYLKDFVITSVSNRDEDSLDINIKKPGETVKNHAARAISCPDFVTG
ncbi:unnamed protein product [Acanthoscelides obtectus]|uniref:Uncharacterized protein n=1 Tax=Acanthoscelides obtectus TaxID=200917 RepID=A0A9P0PUF4_ACAOB|nr:unnamed protein product [Acanthoscelides obtectus]CAK1669517.1 hypothetical protein AOBTE_LOCUS27048 [Acanthoscelides obtectus]